MTQAKYTDNRFEVLGRLDASEIRGAIDGGLADWLNDKVIFLTLVKCTVVNQLWQIQCYDWVTLVL